MPIKGLTESRRLPRLGKIHLGIKKVSQKTGKEYPSATDYFVVPPEVMEVTGEKPTELPILFPTEYDEMFASQFYRAYSMTRGLTCRGDGETCRRMVDTHTGEMANRDSTDIEWKDGLECKGRECTYYDKQCREVMNLQFLLPTVEGLGIWQIDTSSINSIRNINSAIDLIRGVFGKIAMVPLLLTLEPIEVVNPDDGKKKTVRVLNLRTKGTILQLMERMVKPVSEMLLPMPADTEAPGDMITESVELPLPDEGPAPALIMTQSQEPEEVVLPVEHAELWPEDSNIDIDWLRESLDTLRAKNLEAWGEDNLLGYMKITYKVAAGTDTVLAGALQLDKGQAAHFHKQVKEALDRVNNPPKRR